MIARSPVTPARIAASVPCPPSSSDGTRATTSSPSRRPSSPEAPSARTAASDRGDATLHVARAPAVERAVADLAAPRVGGPGGGVARRHDIEVAGQDDPTATRTAGSPDDDREGGAWHLLARPCRVRANRGRVGRDHLDREPQPSQGLGRPGGDRLLRTRDAGHPDQCLQVLDHPLAIDRRRTRQSLSHEGSAASCRSARRTR